MELANGARISLAFAVGLWSLAAQFVFNRVIFFYIANSEYVAASIISIHLAGFWLGTLVAKRRRLDALVLVALSILVMLAANFVVWRLGAATLGLPPTVILAVVHGLVLAGLSGALVVRLMGDAGDDGRGVVIADSAGSVIGAVIGGFILIPQFGLSASFTAVLAFQSLTLLALTVLQRPRPVAFAALLVPVVLAAVMIVQAPRASSATMLVVDGLPIERIDAVTSNILHTATTPYGLVSVVQPQAGDKLLLIDNRPLCGAASDGLETLSEWVVGQTPMDMTALNPREGRLVANIGLGCGVTLAALLSGLPAGGRLDAIEINPGMPAAQKLFWSDLPHTPEDNRVTVHIEDGFRYFAERNDASLYDVVAIDLAWMQNMNATHLFSKEMYANIARNLQDDGVLAIWSEETNPLSPVSLIIYRTLREVFPHVVVDTTSSVTLFYASETRADLANFLPQEALPVNGWIAEVGMMAPVNRLDNLVMNRHKFTLFGDSKWERLFEKYRSL